MHPNKTFFTCFYDKYGFTTKFTHHSSSREWDERECDDEDEEEDEFDYYL